MNTKPMPYRFHLAQNEKMAKRNKTIFDLKEQGVSTKKIAQTFDLSPSRVSQIIGNTKGFSTTEI